MVAVGVEIGVLNWGEVGDKAGMEAERRRFERREEMNAVYEKDRYQLEVVVVIVAVSKAVLLLGKHVRNVCRCAVKGMASERE